ncbi:DUF1127 domain-containing protein [Amaricoccus sp.]|uniref:DUF1127 domain-containing protein n=1 Tax=Amaricoccus sp. TaxID=1872485 RepID=UPI002619DFF3|nr:DUF1127 domain-containing protein [Amaricoccus sp.]HRO10291.1 DUF1127 domain-containing protein [Amaricoccus sp.]
MASTVFHDFGRADLRADVKVPGLGARIGKWLADYRLYRRTLDELEALSDRELADLGLSRLQIRDIAHESVYAS